MQYFNIFRKDQDVRYKKVNIGSGLNEVEVCIMVGKGNIGGAVFYVNKKVQYFDIYQNVEFNWEAYKNENKLLDQRSKYTGYFSINLFSIKNNAGNILRALETRIDVKSTPQFYKLTNIDPKTLRNKMPSIQSWDSRLEQLYEL